ncbi:MAG: hypothetical protein Q7J71_02520, partial [Polaromonas sp.]|nr:hypothetical protein [Polaromonas sp.]
SSSVMVGTPEVKKQKRKTRKALDPDKHKSCECGVRTPLFMETCRFAVEVECHVLQLSAKPVPISVFLAIRLHVNDELV